MRYFYGTNGCWINNLPRGYKRCHIDLHSVYGYVYEFERRLSGEECKRLGLAFLLSLNDEEGDEDD